MVPLVFFNNIMYNTVTLTGTTTYYYIIMDQIIAQLIDYGLTQPQAQVRATVYQYGSNPASTIASLTKLERTHVYKLLTQLEAYGLVECHLK
jgi:DNA-binding MarR family transcriptional regulator